MIRARAMDQLLGDGVHGALCKLQEVAEERSDRRDGGNYEAELELQPG